MPCGQALFQLLLYHVFAPCQHEKQASAICAASLFPQKPCLVQCGRMRLREDRLTGEVLTFFAAGQLLVQYTVAGKAIADLMFLRAASTAVCPISRAAAAVNAAFSE